MHMTAASCGEQTDLLTSSCMSLSFVHQLLLGFLVKPPAKLSKSCLLFRFVSSTRILDCLQALSLSRFPGAPSYDEWMAPLRRPAEHVMSANACCIF